MKFTALLLSIVVLLSCQSKKKEPKVITIPSGEKTVAIKGVALGEQLFNGKGKCKSCHKIKMNSVGPSVASIAEIYKKENGNIVQFLKQEADPIVKPETYAVMKTNFALLKTFTDEELKALEQYMMNIAQ